MDNKKISKKSHWENVMNKNIKKIFNEIISIISNKNNLKNTHPEIDKISEIIGDGKNEKTFFEVGCAPGFYSSIFSKLNNYIPGGIEYTESGYNSTTMLYDEFNFSKENLIKGDFFKLKNDKTFDVVFSAGFIEHFDDPEDVIKRHIEILNQNGYLIIIIPNYHFFFKYFQEFLYEGLMTEQHNLNIMNLPAFSELFNNNKIEKIYLGGIGQASFGHLVSKNLFIQKSISYISSGIKRLRINKLYPDNELFNKSYIYIGQKK